MTITNESKKKFLGLAPMGIFSGFENTFFNALENKGWKGYRIPIELPIFKFLCTIFSFYPNRTIWGSKRDRLYNISTTSFKKKSKYAQICARKFEEKIDCLYQIGGLWNPIPPNFSKPVILSVDYTTILSEKRNAKWKTKQGKEQNFWIHEETKLFQQATMICATTNNAKKSLINDYQISEKKITVVGAGVSYPFNAIDNNRIPNYQAKRILFIGKGYKGKGLDTLLEAFKIVKKEIPESELTIIGPRKKISGNGIKYYERINNKNEIKDIYYNNSLFVMPSLFEPVGQVFLEAMSCKLPCIGTTLDAMPEIIENGISGYTVSPGNHTQLANKVIKLLLNPAHLESMGIAGYNKLIQNFTWDVVGKKINDTINSIL